MVQAKELRIGNKIYLELGLPGLNVHTVMGQDIADIANGRITLNSIHGIPLIPEILEKGGFERIGTHHWFNQNLILQISITKTGDEIILVPNNRYALQVKYVHQFQNLYFSLTGQELEINL